MPRASPQYTLVGFSPELDWKPLTFLKPIPPNRVCSACGLVRKTSALLPCMHVLCGCCYEQCAQDASPVCPLDGNHYDCRDVDLREIPDDHLLSREVKCWNEGSGCRYTTIASGIAHHFQRECEHHSVRCSQCSAAVLCRDVCTHLRSASCNTSMPQASEIKLLPHHLDEAASLTSFKGAFERRAGEITAYLRPMAVDITTHGDRLNEISHGINTLKETLRQELARFARHNHESFMKSQLEMASSNEELKNCFAACSVTVHTCLGSITGLEERLNDKLSGTRDDLAQIGAAIELVKAEVKESALKTLPPVTSLLSASRLNATQCEFFVKGVKSLQDTATKEGQAAYDSEKVYLRGYCMSLGVWLRKRPESVALGGKYTLHKGDMDDVLMWPFEHKIRMTTIHPERGAKDAMELIVYVFFPSETQRPISCNRPSYSPGFFILGDLLSSGYAKNDQLRIKCELLP